MIDVREIARDEASRAVEAHEDVCAERYSNIHNSLTSIDKSVNRVWKILGWAGSVGFLLIISVLGFLLKAELENIAAQQRTIQIAQVAH